MFRNAVAVVAIIVAIFAVSMYPVAIAAPGQKNEKVYRHVVLFKFKAEVSKKQIKEVEEAFAALPKKIDTISDFEWGTDVSVENKAKGFTHCFFVSFRNKKGLEVYLPHPAHKEFVKLVGPRLDDVCVVDYYANK